jgi:hypothetical protein
MAINDIAERLRPIVSSGAFPDELRLALEEAHWDVWVQALFFAGRAAHTGRSKRPF